MEIKRPLWQKRYLAICRLHASVFQDSCMTHRQTVQSQMVFLTLPVRPAPEECRHFLTPSSLTAGSAAPGAGTEASPQPDDNRHQQVVPRHQRCCVDRTHQMDRTPITHTARKLLVPDFRSAAFSLTCFRSRVNNANLSIA